jgi:hypothetical protein
LRGRKFSATQNVGTVNVKVYLNLLFDTIYE